MREHPGKEHPRGRAAARLPSDARSRPEHVKKPRGPKPAKPQYAKALPASPLLHVSRKPAPGSAHEPRPSAAHKAPAEATESGSRIAKVIARAGLCSRREAENWIGDGRVVLNGVTLTNPAVNVQPGDHIIVDGQPLVQRARTRLFLFHKPRGLVTTERDPEGRQTVFDFLREHWPDGPRVVSIGRLDINTEGLLLLSNDGGLARVLELPSTGWVRRYRVRVNGVTDQAILDGLRDGLTLDGVQYAGIGATLDRVQGANSWLTMTLREGKNREIKRVLEHIGLLVNRLIRLSYGPFQLGEITEGAIVEVRTRVLRDQLGPVLTEAAGADFTSPLENESEAADMAEAVIPRSRSSEGRDRESTREPRQTRSRETEPYAAKHAAKPAARERRMDVRAEPKVKPAPRVRKHISALRAEEAETRGPRKRIERRETADRSGRKVHVEHLHPAGAGGRMQEERPAKRAAKDKSFAGRGGRFEDARKERGARQRQEPAAPLRGKGPPSRAKPAPSRSKNWKGPEGASGKTSRGHASGGRPAPRGQGPRTPHKK
ncbi:pseudouridine synthase [Methylocapsa sp. D3K7]|uniref:pseudouridine synthase n=1 Tax=Methylocapsa sp. D3K7 TaxID=3041435 RepID=UPI00244E6D9D|nr:pseudouridine synthase [Methylocapsa sp. D3K7]WGJ14585.1 pseudouridine synthase [Methylocapsa sp. D3K7]